MIYLLSMNTLKNLTKLFRKKSKLLKKKFNKTYPQLLRRFERRPLLFIFSLVVIFLVLIVLGNIIRSPKQENSNEQKVVKNVQVYNIGNSSEISIQGQIEKSGIITVTAQTSGIVKSIDVKAGDVVSPGKRLLSLSSNYQGASVPSIQRQIAGVQYQNTKDTYDTQREIILKQKTIANKQDENADELRVIADNSIERTEDLIDLNQNILDSVNSNLSGLESGNIGGANDDAILSTKQLKSQVQSGLNQLKSTLDNTRYQSKDDNPQAELSNLTREVALKQLDTQEKALELSLKIAGLQLQLAQIQESLMLPSSPINAVVERIYVKEGELVNPGTPLIVIHGDQNLQLIAKIPFDLSQIVSKERASKAIIDNNEIEIFPEHISIDITDGNLSSILYSIPDSYQNSISNNSYINITVPLDVNSKSNGKIYIPIDAVHTLPDTSIIYVVDENKAKTIPVKIESIRGNLAEVNSKDLSRYQFVVTTRNVSDGELISF